MANSTLAALPDIGGTPAGTDIFYMVRPGTSTDYKVTYTELTSGLSGGITQLTGDVTAGPGSGSQAATLATVATAGTTGSSTSIPSVTINAKGLVTSVTGNAVIAPAGTLTGATLAAGVTGSSLTSVGTLATGTWQATTIGVTYGGTGANLSATGGVGQYLKQSSVGGAVTVGIIAAADLPLATSATFGVVKPDNTTISIAAGVITSIGGSATSIVVGTTTVGAGTTGRLLYDNSAVLGELVVGTGLTVSAGNLNIANTITAGGPTGSATAAPIITYNAQGQLTTVSSATITPAASSITGGAALTSANDTNVTLTLGGTPSTALLAAASITAGWTGTLAAGRLNANVVQAVTNDTNVTGSIAAQTLTLGWTGTAAVSRGGTGLGTLTAHAVLLGEGTSNVAFATIGTQYRVLADNGAAADPSFNTLTSVIDGAFSSTQGAILYRGASAWAALAPGTSGQVLQSGGAGANPSWVTGGGGGGGVSTVQNTDNNLTVTNGSGPTVTVNVATSFINQQFGLIFGSMGGCA